MQELKNTATQMRMKVIDMIYKAQSGHPGGSLSAADFVTACYFKYMNLDPKNPRWEDRDRMVLSKGHVCPIQYACLATVGFFPESVLDTLRKEGSMLQGHPSMNRCPGIDISTGSLGQGLACAAGMALAGKLDHKDYKVFCVVGDGEAQEGEVPCLRLGGPGARRPQHGGDHRLHRQVLCLPERQAQVPVCPHRQGQGRFLHGKPVRLARRCPQR